MSERVVPLELGVEWEPNAPHALLVVQDRGVAWLVLNAHPTDADQRPVTLVWEGCLAAVMQPPNDESASGHRLYGAGLENVMWAGEVLDSGWIAELEHQDRAHPRHDPARFAGLRHFILPLKEKTVEIVANKVLVVRSDQLDARLRVTPTEP